MVAFYLVSGVIVAGAVGLFWLKIAIPAWRDFDQSRKPNLQRHWPLCDGDLNDLLEKRSAARRRGMAVADTPIQVREVA